MKRCFTLVFSLLLILSLTACGRAERTPAMEPKSGSPSPSSVSESASGPASQARTDEPQTDPSEELLSIAADFAENYPWAFSYTEQLFPDHFTLWKIYEEDPTALDERGILWVSPERMAAEVELRFGISDFRLREPFWEDEYPRYVEEEGAIAFIPVGEGSRFAVELTGQEAQGEYYDYTFDIYDNFITDGHEEKTLERTVRYRFRVVEGDDGKLFLQAVSATDLSAGAPGGTPDTIPTGPSGGEELHEERFFIAGNNAQGTDVVISLPEHWKAASLDKLVSESGCEVRFEIVLKAPNDLYDRDAYFKGYEAEYSEIIASGDLGDLNADARYYHFLLEHDDGTREDKVDYYVFENGYMATIRLTPAPGKDIQSQRGEFEPYLATLKLG